MIRRIRTRSLLLISLGAFTVAAVGFFVAGAVLPGALATIAGVATLAAAGRHARPANWTAEERDPESR